MAVAIGLVGLVVVSPGSPAASGLSEEQSTPLSALAGSALAAISDRNEIPLALLDEMARGNHFEVDAAGRLRSVEPVADVDAATAAEPEPAADVFALHSRPGSNRTLYLDFTGHSVEGTAWNGGARIDAPPFDKDGDPAGFNDAERAAIHGAFLAVAEDYLPFDVDVTTQEPAEDQITRSDSADQVYGTRVVITPTDVTNCGCGGQAYVGVFDAESNHARYQPAWVYSRSYYDGKLIAEIASHESGHNLGLSHDGIAGGDQYYVGHRNWAPMMGASYYQPVTQWSRGEYANPSNTQDDLAIIPANGADLVVDDHPDQPLSATPLADNAGGVITTDADVDVFAVEHGGGVLTAAAVPAPFGPNLDIRLVVRNAAGEVVATVDPPVQRVSNSVANGLAALFSQDVPAGRYTLHVEGVGFGNPAGDGYTGYASIGQYTLTVA
ncbi:MAG: zinc-dependent metalloprotease [Pseudonocardiaceae bacterium]|nr:zinc-dependent metalloprotease [Pseudonocardiaceae bacterium]